MKLDTDDQSGGQIRFAAVGGPSGGLGSEAVLQNFLFRFRNRMLPVAGHRIDPCIDYVAKVSIINPGFSVLGESDKAKAGPLQYSGGGFFAQRNALASVIAAITSIVAEVTTSLDPEGTWWRDSPFRAARPASQQEPTSITGCPSKAVE